MTDAELTQFLSTAFLPFAKGFASKPLEVTLQVTCSPLEVHGLLRYSAEDYAALVEGSMTDVDIGRAFRVLAQWVDGRRPALVVEATG